MAERKVAGQSLDTSQGAAAIGGAWDTSNGPDPIGHFTDTTAILGRSGSQSG